MDILENGPDRPPLGRGPRIAGLVALLAAALTFVVLTRRHDHPPAARPAPPPPPSPTAVPQLVILNGDYGYDTSDQHFVLQYRIINNNLLPVRLEVTLPAARPGFTRLTAAILGNAYDDTVIHPEYADVESAARTPLTLASRFEAVLAIAGDVDCHVAKSGPASLILFVDGSPLQVKPTIDDVPWPTGVHNVCALN